MVVAQQYAFRAYTGRRIREDEYFVSCVSVQQVAIASVYNLSFLVPFVFYEK